MDGTENDNTDPALRPPPEWWSIAANQVEPYLLGGGRRLTRDEVVERVDLDADEVHRLWLALGFPAAPTPETEMFTEADVRALELMAELVTEGIIDSESQVAIARTVGQSMARLAEWQVDVLSTHIIEGILASKRPLGSGETIREITSSVTELTVPILEELQNYAWRRHLAASASRSFAGKEPDAPRRSLIVGFADMVGYTTLTRHLDANELTALLETFESNAAEIVSAYNGWIVKNVGDEVMFAVDDPSDAAEIALRLHESNAAEDATPRLRVGMASGLVLQRFGDLYGSVVNKAARLTGVAKPGTVLVDSALAEKLEEGANYRLRHLRGVRVRGFRKLKAHVLRRAKQD